MKTQKSSDNEEVTPTKKVLKQARLPFMIISDVSPKSISPQSRKRKLSVPEPEPITKVGKISKDDDLAQELVVISDDDSKEGSQVTKVDKQLNPYVKLVDTAWKKKVQKAKNVKKKKNITKKSKTVGNTSVANDENISEPSNENGDNKSDVVEEMEVIESEEIQQEAEEINKQHTKNDNDNTPPSNDNDKECEKDNIFTVEDSCSDDIKIQNEENLNNDIDCSSSKDEKSLHSNTEKNDGASEEQEKNIKELNDSSTVTPKRSQRNQSKVEDKNTDSSILSNCDESFSSNPSTPRRSTRKVSLTNSQGDISLNESNTKITPKQLQKKLESVKKKEEREKEKTEREKKKQQERDERARQKQEKEEQRKREREEKEEAKKKEKEEKEEQKRKEKEEKEKQKELEKKMREEKEEQKRKEKEEKEEQKKKEKEAREEEKRKKQEALEQEKLEQEQKKKKAAEAFVSFFVPKQKGEKEQVTLGTISNKDILSSFTIKSDMRLAPTTRVTLDEESRKAFDNFLEEQNVSESSLYIKSLKASHKPLCNGKTWPLSDKDDDDDVMIVEDELLPEDGELLPVDGAGETIACDIVKREKLRPKLFAFHENRRPPYWGTWRKKSKFINPRNPFKTDEKLLDYEVDSDEEWEEEQEGESIDGSAAGSDDEQDADEYEVDNEVFVPHGYLSDEEATMDEDDVLSLSPETQKARLKHLEDEFEFEMKKPMEKLKPRLYGLLWETTDGGRPDNCADALWNYFGKLSMIMNDPTPFLQPSSESDDSDKKKAKKKKTADGDQKSPKNEKKKKSKTEDKEIKKPKIDTKKLTQDSKKNQPGINTFLTKKKT
ncbi:chromatin assembly factor 1 subunit A [Nymphalis io]|uniref:chromatin assembly factor 1 subunit A n=1 Tax=Inachis io TaxID=171585 RepID=UPI002168B421|nr:chromatin assembly factor 1 subunit A [Nymphalis io]